MYVLILRTYCDNSCGDAIRILGIFSTEELAKKNKKIVEEYINEHEEDYPEGYEVYIEYGTFKLDILINLD